jgi:uncharacterized protein YbaP (TraB family)
MRVKGSRFALWVASLMLLTGLGCATVPFEAGCSSRPGAQTQAPLMWRAQRGDTGGTLYLLGSIHYASEQVPDFGPVIESAFARSDELVVELDVLQIEASGLPQGSNELGRLEPPAKLSDLISPRTLGRLREYLAARGRPFSGVEDLKPWAIANQIVLMELRDGGYAPEHGVDRHFIERAGARPIVELESAAEQLQVLDGLPMHTQEAVLWDALHRSPEFDPATERLMEAWRWGDERSLEDLVFQPFADGEDFEAFYQAVFFQRNREMARRLASLSADGKTRFTVVGAGHMLGPRGIPSLLCERGFEVLRVSGGAR